MKIGRWLKSGVEYGRDLADSGWQGAREAYDTVQGDEPVRALLTRSARASWAPAAVGAGAGAVCALIATRRRSNKLGALLAMSAVGAVAGFAAGVAWETRELSSEMARGALRGMSPVRDAHWLDKHPINFG